MKKIFFVLFVSTVLIGCSSSSNAVNYRFPDSPELSAFQIKTERSITHSGKYILMINGVAQDTLSGITGFSPNDSKLSTWKNKTVEFSGKFFYYLIYSTVKFRVKVNNEIVLDEWN